MTDSLQDLKSGKLIGVKKLDLACGLKEFPKEILTLAETLEVLDLSDNHLSELPATIVKLKKLRIIFFANNDFTVFPEILSNFSDLEMIGFKANEIEKVAENSFPPKLKWLILTNNKIKQLPKSIGNCHLLQKATIAGNQIEELPLEMANCVHLELLRVSANKLKVLPTWLFELPKLSWVAFGGNLIKQEIQTESELASFEWEDFKVDALLGEGASGFISKANWVSKNKEVAVKLFKGNVTSDGLPEDEMKAAIMAGAHENLIPILGEIKNHPENKKGLIMKLIASGYINLGNPPSLISCTRDIFDENSLFSIEELLSIGKNIASVCTQLHKKGINHGDLYAHNILINKEAKCLLGDFGAASFYDVNADISYNIERVEVRAFACLLEDILNLVDETKSNKEDFNKVLRLINDCNEAKVNNRPSFYEILERLHNF